MDAMAVGAGAVIGAVARYQIGKVAADKIASNPKRFSYFTGWHTAGINITGSFLLGFVVGLPTSNPYFTSSDSIKRSNASPITSSGTIQKSPSSSLSDRKILSAWSKFSITPRMKLLFGTGFCGSFTTFSTFSVDVVNMIGKQSTMKAFSYVCANNLGSFAAAFSGIAISRKICMK